jgi:hypothetical protein
MAMAEPLPRDWWTTRDVATFLGIAPSTIRAYVARGQMPEADQRASAASLSGGLRQSADGTASDRAMPAARSNPANRDHPALRSQSLRCAAELSHI